ncbi:hypothetical protein EMCRGX_G021924 [Ephydatia muelleri]
MKKLVSRTLDSFKRSTDSKEFSRFESICQERFPLQRANPCNYMISRPAVQHDERPAVQHDERPAVQHDKRPAVQHDERPAVQHDERPAVQHDERPAVQHDERPAVQHDERPAVQHDERPAVQHDKSATYNITELITKISCRCGVTLTDVPRRSAIEFMTRELGVIAELQTAEVILDDHNITLGFDATTQEGVHVNSIHITTKTDCFVVAVDELPGGTADYYLHITDAFDNLARVYSHFHGLDTIATKTRAALKQCEHNVEGKVWGKDCIAGNIVLQMNKMRYKNGKGDPRGFTTFLYNERLPCGIIPRYRGNRLHILFHICGIYVEHHAVLKMYLEKGTSCGGLRASILADFVSTTAQVEMQVLGLIGVDTTLKNLREPPLDEEQFRDMIKGCLEGIIEVLERQYKKYFECEITEQLRKETESARSHNIDAEEIMGMFSATKKKSPNATLCYISCKMRALKNRTLKYLDNLDKDTRDNVLKKAVLLGREQRNKRKGNQIDLRKELLRRQLEKQQAKDASTRKKLERRLKSIDIDKIRDEFHDLEDNKLEILLP